MVGVWRHAEARARGMKRVQVEPHLSVTGACSAEWVPIKPKTDAAFLFALIHVLLHEHSARAPRRRLPRTPHGVAVPRRAQRLLPARTARPASRWSGTRDARRGAVRHRRHRRGARGHATTPTPSRSAPTATCSADGALTGDDRLLASSSRTSRRTRREWAERICDVPAATIRRIAHEFIDHARVGETIEIDGMRLPYPPGRGEPRQDGQQRLGRLRMRVGAHACSPRWSAGSKCPAARSARRCASTGRHSDRLASVQPGADGFMAYTAQSDRQGALVAQPEHPQRVPDDGAAGRQRRRGARRSGRRISRGCSSTRRRRACRA